MFLDESMYLSFLPRIDEQVVSANPQQLIMQGLYSKVPLMSGDCKDEGEMLRFFPITILLPASKSADTMLQGQSSPSQVSISRRSLKHTIISFPTTFLRQHKVRSTTSRPTIPRIRPLALPSIPATQICSRTFKKLDVI